MRMINLETTRLLLRAIQENEVNEIWKCWMQDEEVSRYMWWKASYDIAETEPGNLASQRVLEKAGFVWNG